MSRIVYKLNGYNLNTLGIIVKSADGLLDMPDLKKRKECDWADMHGKIIDTARPYFDARKITLDCAWPIEPRGRNLLLGVTNTSGQPTARSCTYACPNEKTITMTATDANTNSQVYYVSMIPNFAELAGKEVTFSIEKVIKSNAGTKPRIYLYDNTGTTSKSLYFNADTANGYSYTFTFPDIPSGTTSFGLLVRANESGGGGEMAVGDTVTYIGLKLEEGNKATDWTPNPADLGLDVATEGGTFNIQTAEEMVREKMLALGGLVRLEVHFDNDILVKPLIFNVIQDKGITFGRKYSGSDVLLTFKIQLIEPQPCKMVLESKYSRNNNTRTTTSVAITSTAMFDVDWGDGTTTFDVKTSEAVTHTYSGQGTYYVIISGDVAAITSLTKSSDLDTLWTLK